MNKKLLHLTIFILLIFSCFGSINQLCGCEAKPKTPIIAFDLHGVVLTYDWAKILPTIINFDQKWALVKNLYKLPFKQLFAMIYNRPSFEQFLEVVGQGNDPLRDLLIALSVQQKLVPEIASLIQVLKQRGYCIHVVSNIGAESFRRLKNRFYNTFSLFTFVLTSNSHDHNGYLIKKPDIKFFENYVEKIHSSSDDIIFIDDREENVLAARSIGMKAILFKNPEQLQEECRSLGLIP